jgi:hypothetical protein
MLATVVEGVAVATVVQGVVVQSGECLDGLVVDTGTVA